MRFKEKIIFSVLALAILNLAFLFGQIFYYSRKEEKFLPSYGSNENLSATLLKESGERFVLLIDNKELAIDANEFSAWIEKYTRDYNKTEEYRINEKSVLSFLNNLANEINVPAINAKLEITNGKVNEFSPSQSGRILNTKKTLANIIYALARNNANNGQIKSPIITDDIQPEITLDKINQLGIKTLLGHGESSFAGSSSARKNNIEVSSKIFNDILLKPRDEFSFTKLLGIVDDTTGYKSELVIKKNKVIPEYGGGICQVSTTLFRAAIFAGLPILERHPHSLPVHYYTPQGFDATVYPGSADLKFKNDTPAYILLQAKISGSKISFDIYGTSDNREVNLDGPRQYDINPDGSLKAEFTRTITYSDGTKKEDTFKSSYQSPSLFPTIRNPLE